MSPQGSRVPAAGLVTEPWRSAAPKPNSAALPAGERQLGARGVLGTIFGCLLVGHLAISGFFPSLAINGVGIALVTLILGRLLFIKNDVFAYVLVVFFCSQFDYANHQGGLFNLAAFLLGAGYLLLGPEVGQARRRDAVIATLTTILLVSNYLGLLIRNPMPPFVLLLQGASFSGIILTFVIASRLYLSPSRLRVLLNVSSVMIVYNFIVSLNQHYSILKIATPLLGLTESLLYATTNAFGVFGSASSNGQYPMMMLALLVPLVAVSGSREKLRIVPLYYVPVIVICGLTIILANMRAAALEAIVIMVIYTIMFSLLYRRSFRNSKYINLSSAGAVVLLVTAGVWVGLQNIGSDFKAVKIDSASSIESGDALNRAGPWKFGEQVLADGSWWIGFGHGNDKSNLLAWGGQWRGTGRMTQDLRPGEIIGGGHFHNLYLALPTLYGWFGAIAYVLLFVVVVVRLVGAIRRYPLGNILVATCLGFAMSLMFFLLDEVKSGNAVQTINYAMVVWIWLGLGLAAHRTLNLEAATSLARRAKVESDSDGAEKGGSGASGIPDKAGEGKRT